MTDHTHVTVSPGEKVSVGGVLVEVELYRGELFIHVGNVDMSEGCFPAPKSKNEAVARVSLRVAAAEDGPDARYAQAAPRLYLYPQRKKE